MASKILVNLTTGMEDGEKVMIAFLVAGAALDRGNDVATPMFEWLGDEPGQIFSY